MKIKSQTIYPGQRHYRSPRTRFSHRWKSTTLRSLLRASSSLLRFFFLRLDANKRDLHDKYPRRVAQPRMSRARWSARSNFRQHAPPRTDVARRRSSACLSRRSRSIRSALLLARPARLGAEKVSIVRCAQLAIDSGDRKASDEAETFKKIIWKSVCLRRQKLTFTDFGH